MLNHPAPQMIKETIFFSIIKSSGAEEEEISEAQAVCEAIDRLLSGIDSSEHDTSSTSEAELSDSELKTSTSEPTTFSTPKIELDELKPNDDTIAFWTPELNVDEQKSAGDETEFSTPEVDLDLDSTLEASSYEQDIFSTPEGEDKSGLEADVSGDGDGVGGDDVKGFTSPEIHLGDIHKVLISHIQTPSSFFCQLFATCSSLSQLMETIQTTFTEHTEDTLTLDTPTVGTPCCAQSPYDDKWYRAVVTETRDDDVDISFVDYGNTASVSLGKLKAIDEDLIKILPFQALHCSLVDLEPANSEWSVEAVMKMKEVCIGKELEGIFRSVRRKKYDIYLRDPENDVADFVNKLLVDLKLAKVTGRDSDSDEGADSNGNNGSSKGLQGTEPAGGDGQQVHVYQNQDSESKTMDIVRGILDDVVEKVIHQHQDTVADESISDKISEQIPEEAESEPCNEEDDFDELEAEFAQGGKTGEEVCAQIEGIICEIKDALVQAVDEAEETAQKIEGLGLVIACHEKKYGGSGEDAGDVDAVEEDVRAAKEALIDAVVQLEQKNRENLESIVTVDELKSTEAELELGTSTDDDVTVEEDFGTRDDVTGEDDVSTRDDVNGEEDVSIRDDVNGEDDVSTRDDVTGEDDVSVTRDGVNGEDDVSIRDDVNGEDDVSTREDVRIRDDVNGEDDVRTREDVSSRDDVNGEDDVSTREDVRIRDDVNGDISTREDVSTRDDVNGEDDVSTREDVKCEDDINGHDINTRDDVSSRDDVIGDDVSSRNDVVEQGKEMSEKKEQVNKIVALSDSLNTEEEEKQEPVESSQVEGIKNGRNGDGINEQVDDGNMNETKENGKEEDGLTLEEAAAIAIEDDGEKLHNVEYEGNIIIDESSELDQGETQLPSKETGDSTHDNDFVEAEHSGKDDVIS